MRRALTFIEITALVAALPAIAMMATPQLHPTSLDARGIILIVASVIAVTVETLRRMP